VILRRTHRAGSSDSIWRPEQVPRRSPTMTVFRGQRSLPAIIRRDRITKHSAADHFTRRYQHLRLQRIRTRFIIVRKTASRTPSARAAMTAVSLMAPAFRFLIQLFAAAAFTVTSRSRRKARLTSRTLRAVQEIRLGRTAWPCRKITALPGELARCPTASHRQRIQVWP